MYFLILPALYVSGVILYALYASRHETRSDFIIGGRNFSSVHIAFSIVTSWFSAGGLVYYYFLIGNDLPTMLFLTLGAMAGLYTFSFFAKGFYDRAVEKHYVTMTEYVTGDLGKKSGLVCAIINPLLFLGYFLFELIATGLLLSELTNWSYLLCLLISGGVVCFYLLLGGFKVLLNSDFIQALLISFFIIVFGLIFYQSPAIEISEFMSEKPGLSITGFLGAFVAFFGASMYGADTWQRALCDRSGEVASRGLRLASGLYFLVYGGLTLLLMGLFSLEPGLQHNQGYHFLIYEFTPPFLGALLLTTLIATMMSTLDTVIFIISQGLTTDIAFQFNRRLDKPKLALRVAILTVVTGGITFAYYIRDIETVFWVLLSYWVCVCPSLYLFVPKYKPSDNTAAITMMLLAVMITVLHVTGSYQDYQTVFFLVGGLILPPLLDRLYRKV